MARDEIQQRVEEELPVVARLVIEIRSDGSRTVARGALEQVTPDGTPGRVAVEARGGSPAALALDLLRSVMSTPFQSSLARWTRREVAGVVEGAEVVDGAGAAAAPGLIGRVRRELTGRLRRRFGTP